jgi:NSS family neurotransmitter:Na+ symporter
MASVGFAIGLGNIWKFPYLTGENGGGAFVLIYLFCACTIGIPILMAEVLIGRRGRMSANESMRAVAIQEGKNPNWHWLGAMTMVTAFLILVTYSVVAGWVLEYLFKAGVHGFQGISETDSVSIFANVLANSTDMIFWAGIALGLTAFIVSAGVQKGIERTVTILMPLLFSLLVLLVIYGSVVGDFSAALNFLFVPDLNELSAKVVLVAIGQTFFSVGVAMAGMMTYGAYLPKSVSIGRSISIIVVADTFVALLAGFAIFPLVFQHGLDPSGGPGLIFETLPLAFSDMPGGQLFSIMFFTLLSVAAITSMVGLLEPLVSWAEENKNISRRKGGIMLGIGIWILSFASIYSYNGLSGFHPFQDLPFVGGKNINDVLGMMTDQFLLPIGGLMITLFAGWIMSKESTRDELALGNETLFSLWHFLIRFVVPPAVLLVFILGFGG